MDPKSLSNSNVNEVDDFDDAVIGSDEEDISDDKIEKHTLSKRRKIEELLEQRRLKKLLDDDFNDF